MEKNTPAEETSREPTFIAMMLVVDKNRTPAGIYSIMIMRLFAISRRKNGRIPRK
jgi:hypothetical protein